MYTKSDVVRKLVHDMRHLTFREARAIQARQAERLSRAADFGEAEVIIADNGLRPAYVGWIEALREFPSIYTTHEALPRTTEKGERYSQQALVASMDLMVTDLASAFTVAPWLGDGQLESLISYVQDGLDAANGAA